MKNKQMQGRNVHAYIFSPTFIVTMDFSFVKVKHSSMVRMERMVDPTKATAMAFSYQ